MILSSLAWYLGGKVEIARYVGGGDAEDIPAGVGGNLGAVVDEVSVDASEVVVGLLAVWL